MPNIETTTDNRSLEQRIALERQLLARINGRRQGIPRRDDDAPCQLSFAQQRLWFMDQAVGNLTAYNMPFAWKLRGKLRIEVLRRALQEVVRRHEPLRTTCRMSHDGPVQVILPSSRFGLSFEDLSSLDLDRQESEFTSRFQLEAKEPFDLSADLMLRASLLRLAADKHMLLLTLHHIAFDGWSAGILLRELSQLYDAFQVGNPSPLEELPVRYADYAHWQRESLQGESERRSLAYWREQLRGAPTKLDLPTDWPRLQRHSFEGASQNLILSSELTDAIKRLGQREGTTPFMTLLTAFKVLLSRLSGQHDVVVGSPVAGRDRAELEPLIGLFVNMLVLRTHLSKNPTFRELLVQVRKTMLEALDHQNLPFEKLVEAMQPERSLSRGPLFQVVFNGVSIDPPRWDVSGLSAQRINVHQKQSKCDLTMYVLERNKQLRLHLNYDTELFSAERIACFLQQYQCLLEQAVAAPGAGIDSYSLITSQTRELLPDPRVALESPKQVSVVDQFSAFADKLPDQIAVRHGNSSWTYAELAQAANQFARTLAACDTARGHLVAVYGVPSFGLISSIIGVLQYGAVLVLIDPLLPKVRQQQLIDRSGAHLLAIVGDTESDIESSVGDRAVLHVARASGDVTIYRGIDRTALATHSVRRLPEDAAYIFFTSGTMGIPKGVVGSHSGLSQFLEWQRTTFAIGMEDRVAQLSGLSFEPVMRDVFLPLTTGGTLCLPESREPDEIWSWLERERVTILHTVPSLISSWISFASRENKLSAMRYVFFAGSPLHSDLIQKWRAVFRCNASLVNLYGTTETPQGRTYYKVPPAGNLIQGPQPIGRSIASTQALILRGNNQLCGIGEVGEIAIRTPFLSLGYLDADLTQGRFVANPFRDDPGDMIYLTGDLGRYRPDGLLDIQGRLDDQMKIGGVRIEPAEIASLLSAHEQVDDCYVGTGLNEHSEPQLVAWVVFSPSRSQLSRADRAVDRQPSNDSAPAVEPPLTARQMRDYLTQHLPRYMVPAAYVALDKLPLTANGKIDRRLLPTPVRANIAVTSDLQAPRDALEMQLTKIWEDVLNVQHIGVDDNFFDLGGHSLLAVNLLNCILHLTGKKLPISSLFKTPSVRLLAEVLREENWLPRWNFLIPVQPGGSKIPLFLVPPAACTGMRFVLLSRYLGDDQPLYSFDLLGRDDLLQPLDRVEDIAAEFLQEMVKFQPRGPYLLGGRCFGAHVAYEMAQQLLKKGQSATVLVLDASAPFNGPYWTNSKMNPITHWNTLINKSAAKDPHTLAVYRCQMMAARWNYCAKPFLGNVAIFQSENVAQRTIVFERWSSLVLGKFTKFLIPQILHQDMLRAPGVCRLAEQIQGFLEDSHSVQNLD